MIHNLVAFSVAAILEILGCFTFWLWQGRSAPERNEGRETVDKPPQHVRHTSGHVAAATPRGRITTQPAFEGFAERRH
jgi:hypothetical protein